MSILCFHGRVLVMVDEVLLIVKRKLLLVMILHFAVIAVSRNAAITTSNLGREEILSRDAVHIKLNDFTTAASVTFPVTS